MRVHRKDGYRETLLLSGAILAVVSLAFPPQAYALEVGCFCTFVFISSMLMLSLGVTLVSKSLITKRFWRLSWKRVSLITVLELIVLFAILLLIQKVFYVRLLIYLPFAFLLNFAMISSTDAIQQGLQTRRRRVTLAAISALILPVMISVVGSLTAYLSSYITFKEMRV